MEIIIALFVIFLGFIFGKQIEKKHINDILRRERELKNMPWRNTGKKEVFPDAAGVLVSGHVVIAQDAFKSFLAMISFIFGGRVTAYESLIERGRREAILRMKKQANLIRASEIINVRINTSTISVNSRQAAGGTEIFCYGTALITYKTIPKV